MVPRRASVATVYQGSLTCSWTLGSLGESCLVDWRLGEASSSGREQGGRTGVGWVALIASPPAPASWRPTACRAGQPIERLTEGGSHCPPQIGPGTEECQEKEQAEHLKWTGVRSIINVNDMNDHTQDRAHFCRSSLCNINSLCLCHLQHCALFSSHRPTLGKKWWRKGLLVRRG